MIIDIALFLAVLICVSALPEFAAFIAIISPAVIALPMLAYLPPALGRTHL